MRGSSVPGSVRLRRLAIVAVCMCAFAGSLEGQAVAVDCPEEECHVVPIAEARGGFVGRPRLGVERVVATLVCRGTGTTKVVARELVPGGSGLVSTVFGVDDGSTDALACDADEDATIEIRGLTDGGWYWIHDELNTAIAPLLAKEVLANRKVRPVNPGSPDILIEANRSDTASFVKQFSTGRVGILSHVLPEPERDVLPCGPVADGETEDGSPRYVAGETGCNMGDGGTVVGLHIYGAPAGRVPVRGGRVTRPASGSSRIGVSLWLNRTGSVVHGDPRTFPPTFGWPGIEGSRPLLAEWEVTLLDAGPRASLETAGIDLTEFARPDDDGYVILGVRWSEEYCPDDGEQHSARVRVRAISTTDVLGQPLNPVRPRIRHLEDLDGAAAEAAFDVACPPSDTTAVTGAEKGRDLVVGSGVDRR